MITESTRRSTKAATWVQAGIADQQQVAAGGGGLLEGAGEFAEVPVGDVGHDQPDGEGPAETQRSGEGVGTVVELAGSAQHFFAGAGGNVARTVVEHVAHHGCRRSGQDGYVFGVGHDSPTKRLDFSAD
jgi:hypothetical protein